MAKRPKLSRAILHRWVWLSLKIFPVYVAEMRGQKVRVIFSDFSGAEKWRSASEVISFASKQEVLKELRDGYKQLKGQWGKPV